MCEINNLIFFLCVIASNLYAQQVINCESDIGGNEIDYNLDVRCFFVGNFMKLNILKCLLTKNLL